MVLAVFAVPLALEYAALILSVDQPPVEVLDGVYLYLPFRTEVVFVVVPPRFALYPSARL
jgi:hypothetical protein